MPDLRDLPLGRLCNFVYYKITDGADEKQRDQFRTKLWMPPKGVVPDARSPWSPKNETAALVALAAQTGNSPMREKQAITNTATS